MLVSRQRELEVIAGENTTKMEVGWRSLSLMHGPEEEPRWEKLLHEITRILFLGCYVLSVYATSLLEEYDVTHR